MNIVSESNRTDVNTQMRYSIMIHNSLCVFSVQGSFFSFLFLDAVQSPNLSITHLMDREVLFDLSCVACASLNLQLLFTCFGGISGKFSCIEAFREL